MDTEEVENLRKVYNKEHPDEPQIPQGTIKSVWNEIRKRLHRLCKEGTTECIIHSMMDKPDAPSSWVEKPGDWLSSLDIEKIEKEFMKLFSKYYFVGAIPIDFDKKSRTGSCIVSSLCSMNIRDIYAKGKTKIGIVFNTDVSTGPGQHWIALYVDLNPLHEFTRITYFDSYSHSPEPEIQRLMFRWKQQWDETKIHKKPTKLTFNKTRHQYEDSECGMYCLYFHYCSLLEIPMDKRVPDDVMRSFRGLLFSIGKK